MNSKRKEYLEKVCNQIQYKPIRKHIADELENHVEEQKENYIQQGEEEAIAEQKAIQQMGEPEEIGKNLNKIHRPKLDWKVILGIMLLLFFGGVVSLLQIESTEGRSVLKFAIYTIVGLILGIVIYFMDYSKMKKYNFALYGIATFLMLITLFQGITVGGAKSYLDIGILYIDITVIVVPLYIIAFCGWMCKDNSQKVYSFRKWKLKIDRIKIIITSILSIILLLQIPSISYAILLTSVYLIITTVKILSLKEKRIQYLTILYGILMVFIIIAIVGMGEFRINRVLASFVPEVDPLGSGWIGMQQKEILQNAQWIGSADVEINSQNYEVINDGTNYVFISLVGNYGWLVGIVVLLGIAFLSWCFIRNSKIIYEQYGKLLTIGLASMILLQGIWNILMNLNLGIQTSVILPFVSGGGTAMIVNIMCVAILLSIYRRKNIQIGELTQKQDNFV